VRGTPPLPVPFDELDCYAPDKDLQLPLYGNGGTIIAEPGGKVSGHAIDTDGRRRASKLNDLDRLFDRIDAHRSLVVRKLIGCGPNFPVEHGRDIHGLFGVYVQSWKKGDCKTVYELRCGKRERIFDLRRKRGGLKVLLMSLLNDQPFPWKVVNVVQPPPVRFLFFCGV